MPTKNIHLQRTCILLQLPGGRKIYCRYFQCHICEDHQYDLPFQYNGNSSIPVLNTIQHKKTGNIGKEDGYQFLWKEAEAAVKDNIAAVYFF